MKTHVTLIHGIANKPEENKLKQIWLDALANPFDGHDGVDLGIMGVTTSMIYWADVLYSKPEEILQESVSDLESVETVAEKQSFDPDMSWRETLSGEEKQLIDGLAARFTFDSLVNDDYQPDDEGRIVESGVAVLERIPLPWFVKRRMMKWLLRDVHHYLFDYEFSPRSGTNYYVQQEIRSRVLKKLNAVKADRHIVMSHSMGTVIMYDCLMRVTNCPGIDGFITVGSPLGIDEVQDKLAPEWSRHNGFPGKVKGRWVNVYDKLDPVTGFDGNFARDFCRNGQELVEVINEQNFGSWRHNITSYLSKPKLRQVLSSMLT